MSPKTSLKNVSRSCNRGVPPVPLITAVLSLALFCDPGLNAQTLVSYLQQIPTSTAPTGKLPPAPTLPTTSYLPARICPPQDVPSTECLYGPFNLPGYGPAVYVSFSGDVPQLGWRHESSAELQSTSNKLYAWGTDTDDISLYNTSGYSTTYTINFYFDGGAPDPSDLFLVVVGLGANPASRNPSNPPYYNGTNVTLFSSSPAAISPGTGFNAGEYQFSPTSSYSYYSSPTILYPNNWTLQSGYTAASNTDPYNTGWDLYKPNSPGSVLSLQVNQDNGDGIGITLAYGGLCPTLVGNSYDSQTNNEHLYDIDPKTGVATNARPIGWNWGLAFSPMSPEGTLYALVQNLGTPVGNALVTVNPGSGAATQVATLTGLVLNGGALAADPTTGTLYGTDQNGNLFTVSDQGAVTPIGPLPSTDVSAMAFDSAGDLFIVDADGPTLLEVNKKTLVVISSVNLSGLLSWTGPGRLAIYPWSEMAYYAQGGYLYTLNLTTGTLTSPVLVTGAEDHGYLGSLTFMLGACKVVPVGVL